MEPRRHDHHDHRDHHRTAVVAAGFVAAPLLRLPKDEFDLPPVRG
ncbi:MAG TPA: hypothetical protein VFV89_23205 [Nocardioides sp.]|nr:hypothetical protein [Nocardioides sp.]HEX5090736.1 hypothetical protein [Nocardioides sp.]